MHKQILKLRSFLEEWDCPDEKYIRFELIYGTLNKAIGIKAIPSKITQTKCDNLKNLLNTGGYIYEHRFKDRRYNIGESYGICHDFIIWNKQNKLEKAMRLIQ